MSLKSKWLCRRCDSENDAGTAFCVHCDYRQSADANPSRPVRQHSGDRSAHTPGPLVARRINGDAKPFAVINPNGPFGDDIVAGYLGEADATLYAAAPEMLAALQECVDQIADDTKHAAKLARSAIAKATGA